MRRPGAAACSGCHPTSRWVGHRRARGLSGATPRDIVTAMQEFQRASCPATVMDRIAKGFSDDEIKAIAAWYGAQKD